MLHICSILKNFSSHYPKWLYQGWPQSFPLSFPLGSAPGTFPMLTLPSHQPLLGSARCQLLRTGKYQEPGHSLTSDGAGRRVLLLPALHDPSRSKAGSDPAADSAACLLTQVTGSCCCLALAIWRGDRLEQPPPRRDGNGAVGGGTRGRCLMMFMKHLLWLPRQLEPKDWHPRTDALGQAPKGWQTGTHTHSWHPGTGIQGLAPRDWCLQCQQQPLAQHVALLCVRGSGTAKPLDDIPLKKKISQWMSWN